MNTVRKMDLKKLVNLNPVESVVFSHFFGNKGRNFKVEALLEKLEKHLIPKDTKATELEKTKAKASADIKAACESLIKIGVIQTPEKEGKAVEGEFTMPAYEIADLEQEKQVFIGDKVHTTLTANPNQVFYKGDGILYMPHPLSPERKSGIRVAVGELKSFHVNEEGFLYLILLKARTTDKDGKEQKRGQCAVKASQAQLVSEEIPKGAGLAVTYKKKAGLKEPALQEMPDVSKGRHVILFGNIWGPNAQHMAQIVDGLAKAKKISGALTTINTDHQVSICETYKIRTAPTLVVIENGKEVSRLVDLPAEGANEAILKLVK